MNKARAIKKIEIAIDKMIDLQDGGWGRDQTQRILDSLNDLLNQIRNCI